MIAWNNIGLASLSVGLSQLRTRQCTNKQGLFQFVSQVLGESLLATTSPAVVL